MLMKWDSFHLFWQIGHGSGWSSDEYNYKKSTQLECDRGRIKGMIATVLSPSFGALHVHVHNFFNGYYMAVADLKLLAKTYLAMQYDILV